MTAAILSDLHLGAFGNSALTAVGERRLSRAIEIIIDGGVGALFLGGDLTHSPAPGSDVWYRLLKLLKKVVKEGIPIFVISGSHDVSVGRVPYLSVIDVTGFWRHLGTGKHTVTFKNGEKLPVGVLGGRRGGLEVLNADLKRLAGPKRANSLFLFHTALSDALPNELTDKVPALSISDLPGGWGAYCGSHLHWRYSLMKGKSPVFSPGILLGSNDADVSVCSRVEIPFIHFRSVQRPEVSFIPLGARYDRLVRLATVDVTKFIGERGFANLRVKLAGWAELCHRDDPTSVGVVTLRGKGRGESFDSHALQRVLSPPMAGSVLRLNIEIVKADGTPVRKERTLTETTVSDRVSGIADKTVAAEQALSLFREMSIKREPSDTVSGYKAGRISAGCQALQVPEVGGE